MAFIKLGNKGIPQEPRITISKEGAMYVNKYFSKEADIENNRFFEVFIDKENSLLGIKPVKTRSDGVYGFYKQRSGNHYTTRVKALPKILGIRENTSYKFEQDNSTGMFIADIKNPLLT